MVGNYRNAPSSQSYLFFSCPHSESFHGMFSSVEAGLNGSCNSHQAIKGKQWYINQEQSPFLSL